MSWRTAKEINQIETVGELRAALADAPDEMAIADGYGRHLIVRYLVSADGRKEIEIA